MIIFVVMANSAMTQTSAFTATEKKCSSKAWEFGVGGSVLQFNRTSFSNFTQLETGYVFNLKLDNVVFGGNLYAAKELTDHFSVDLQGTIGAITTKSNNKNTTEMLYMIGPGLQWRVGEYFDSKNIDPYLRAGINYMYKEFEIVYAGTEGLDDEQMKWVLSILKNKTGVDRKHLTPISLGAGLNLWLSDSWGIGMQGDYLIMPYGNVANSLQGTIRIMYRIGDKK